jgi:hypothetical protein
MSWHSFKSSRPYLILDSLSQQQHGVVHAFNKPGMSSHKTSSRLLSLCSCSLAWMSLTNLMGKRQPGSPPDTGDVMRLEGGQLHGNDSSDGPFAEGERLGAFFSAPWRDEAVLAT